MKKRALATIAILAAAAALSLASCGRDTTRPFADRFIEAENKAWGTGDLHDLSSLEDANVVYHLPGGVDLVGWKAHEDFILKGRPTVSDLKQDWKYLSGEGAHFVLSYASSAILTGDQNSSPQRVSNNYLFVFRMQGQKIVEVWANGSTTNTPLKETLQ